MGSITIRNLDDSLKRRLRVRAAENGRSTEEEARDILRRSVAEPRPRRISGAPPIPASPLPAASSSTFPNAAQCVRCPSSDDRAR